ncbi:hypothetical protein HELRODRAFT_67798, partial [Helobdella robusta]|uniref:Nicotinamide phosphoribosyltransferase n=1 Tax=Helobdella robusta TaxID=6412 RepID=T1FZ55_HELRO
KVTHHKQYPADTTYAYSYFESRGGKFDKTLFFGLQYILKRWMVGEVVTEKKIIEAKEVFEKHFGQDVFYEEGWRYILKEHKGKLPLLIKAVPEGTILPYRNVLFTIENTDPKCFWLTNYFETLLVQTWYPMTVATNSYYQKCILKKYMSKTADSMDSLKFQLHDFGYRGCSSVESAAIGGMSHLVNFEGTDTIAGLLAARTYYSCKMAGHSIPAAEHSTITTWGESNELEAFKNMLTQFPDGCVAVVSDSYDIFKACEQIWGEKLKDCVVNRGKNGGRLIIRPDSGDPVETVCHVLKILGEKFGTALNKKGYKVLPNYLRVIQGDGISYESLNDILKAITDKGWSAENLVFGSGGALLQRLDRDTQKCAFKCSAVKINDKLVNVFKDPIGDSGKKSKKGKLKLLCNNGVYTTVEQCSLDDNDDILEVVFVDGELKRDCTLDEVRKIVQQYEFCEIH